MFMKNLFFTTGILLSNLMVQQSVSAQPVTDSLRYNDEKHFKNIQQLTFGGDNAEAYWSYDGKKIIFK